MTMDANKMLLNQLDKWHEDYTPELRMVRKPFHTPGYHSTLKDVAFTHPTLAACVYALGLLDSRQPLHVERAQGILEQVISLQDQNPEHATFGIWSWFYEEPLERMAPPDWNWADFCGKRLVLAEQRHSDILSPELREQIRHALYCACDAIIKRNVGPSYTNIAIMGAFVTLLTGEVYGEEKYLNYGLERLRLFSEYTKQLGTFQEYNSPTYTIVAIQELSSIHTATQVAEAKQLSSEMLDVAWGMVAEHFHVPSKQWSGPHSRAYHTMMTPEVLSFLQLASQGELVFMPDEQLTYNLDWYGNDIGCPEKYIPAFKRTETAEHVQTISKDEAGDTVNQATTYMEGPVSVGTFSKDVMWNQRRNLLAYVRNGDASTYIHLRLLNEGYDYSSGIYSSVQKGKDVLFGIGFCTNGGNTHIGLDPIDGTIESADLRVRFEIGGSQHEVRAEAVSPAADSALVHIAEQTLQVKKIFAAFDDEQPRWELGQEPDKRFLDYVIYAGERKKFDFASMQEALLLFAWRLGEQGDELDAEASVVQANAEVRAEFRAPNRSVLQLTLPLKPAEKMKMLRPRP
ncbi:hypothetical protein HZF08_05180 [Paenibacillus sp. CGMCC 1.16610]|uniref:Heparinase n=1 Tax=Paenibacillus anseongense TaxID=2682845 RepID=A0ABW9UB93_9BACL|nr:MULTISPECIES: hypothetical protein [Paenibacillus]MBA2937688.1 hypothetical protein [Paenibacillus sp. CGMCC 1.16610]MVQ36746.1 hypothetical protein [Paenibacillus anseongense]